MKKKDEGEKIVRKGNFELSSRQMEHAILIALIEKLTCTLEKQDILLDITIDGDLNSNKTLGNVGIINQIFADLKHLTKNIRKNLKKYTKWQEFEQHIMNYFSACIYTAEICWIKQNPEIQLCEPTLKLYTNNERNQFKTMLESIFKIPFGQGIGTTTRTSQNEAFNRIKLVYISKLIDYSVSYQARHSLAILHNNEGICEIINIARQVCNTLLSHQDLLNISKIEKERDQQQINNIGRIEKRNTDRELVSYGKKTQEQINSNSFQLSFAIFISDFNEKTKCIACHSFPKCTARGLCRVCRFYIDNGLKNQIIDKSYQPKNEIIEIINFETICKSAIEGIFQFSKFRSGQKEAIQSFTQNKDTLVLKQTGGGKSLCYALASIIVTGITVVFSPLKALVDDQVSELIKVGIPCCVFQEIACGLIRVIITTPEKFKFNIGFQKMLERIGNSKGIYFVIDEAHCILDQEHFRDSWNYLYNLKKIFPAAPILLLTATCQISSAQEIVSHLGIDYQQISLIRDNNFEKNSIIFQVQKKKDNKEQFLEDILKIINEIEIGKCIIYCITIKSCEELFTNLQEKVSKEIINIYHSELSAKEKSNTFSLWKTGNIRIIVATNAFGNLVQESGCAGRDRLPAKAIIFFNRKDIKTVIGVYMGGQRQEILYLKNVMSVIIVFDKPVYVDIQSDMKKMLEIIDVITKTEQQITRNNVVDVFRQSQAKDIKERFGSFVIYQEKFIRKLKTKEDVFLLLDNLILRKLVEEDIILNRLLTGQTYSCSIFIFGLVENALEKVKTQSWNYLIK
ncbi:hypothetical protein Glove_303g107 [Diversispora epigaea]|uniref:DNA 3'-5' helicase n=1 Tax=Diversispora epigaea TaxID=1348612 RepID=A0A397I119_9GLOM|nr:hypothetical protein Glove_303g107 [Diversispora epigaea]